MEPKLELQLERVRDVTLVDAMMELELELELELQRQLSPFARLPTSLVIVTVHG